MRSERERFQGITDTEYRHEGMAAGLVDRFAELGDAYGAEMLQNVIRRMHEKVERGEVMSRGELVALFAEQTTRQEFQEAALRYMEKDGFVSYREDGALVVHAQKLLSEFQLDKYRIQETEYSERMGIRPRNVPGKETFGRSKVEFLANTFDGLEVVLDGEDKDAEPKPLFYLPKTNEEALDPEHIRKAEFHMGLWEIPYAGQSISFRETHQPSAVEDVKFLEASIAALVYHPRYGAGERKGRDRLVVKDDDGKDVLFSGAWLADRIFVRDESHHSNALNSTPVDALMRHAPKLFRRDALRLSDFRITGEGTYEPERSRVTTSGEVSVNNVKYYLGRRFHETPIRVERVVPGLGAVVELDQENNLMGKVVATFTMYEAGDPVLTRQETGTGTAWRAGAKEVDLYDYSEESFNRLSDGERVDDLRERIEAMDRFQMVLGFDNALKRETRTRLRELPRKEIDWIRQSPELMRAHKEDALALARDYERDGLELAALIADIPKIIPEVHRTLGRMTPEERRVFLDGFKNAARARRDAIEALDQAVKGGRMPEGEARRIRFELGSQIGELVEASDMLGRTRRALGSEDIINRLRERSDSVVIFTQTFRDAFKGAGADVDMERIRGVSFGERAPESFSDAEREEMLEIFDENWADQERLAAESFRGDLKRGFDPKNNTTHFYVTKKDGKMVGFIRFDHRDDLEPGAYYAGSLNIRPEYRGSAVGEAMLEKTIQHEAKNHTIYGHVVVDAVVGAHYVEDGSIVTGVKWIEKNGERVAELAIRKDNAKNAQYRARREGISHEKLLMGVPGVAVRSFDYAQEKDSFLKAIEEASRAGNVITRYWIDPKDKNRRYIALEREVSLEPEVALESASEAA